MIPISAYFRSIASTENGTQRKTKKSRTIWPSQFAQLWTTLKNDYGKSQYFFSKCLEKQTFNWFYIRNAKVFQHNIHSRTTLVFYMFHSEFDKQGRWRTSKSSQSHLGSWLILMSGFSLFIFLYEKTYLITEIFLMFPFSTMVWLTS